MSVVYGTDFSVPAQAGAAAAAALARHLGESLWLVHALDPEALFWSGSGGEERARDLLAAAADELRGSLPDLEVHEGLVHGPAHEGLARLADAREASLLVVSSQGHSSSPLFRVGGTSERLALASGRPVLVLREAHPFVSWAAGERPLRVLLGLDETAASEGAIGFVRTLREAGPCDVIAARVYFVPDERRRYGLEGLTSWVDPDPEVEALVERELRQRLPELPGSGSLSYRGTFGLGRLGDHLLRLAELERVDLVVVGSHRRTGLARLGSVSSVLLHFGRMAVASIPTPGEEEAATVELPPMRRVAAATDLSPFANHAIRHAYALVAGREGAEVFLLHVAGKEAPGGGAAAELAARLRELVPPEGSQVPTRTEILHGEDVAAALCAAAERLGVDALAIASHGKTGVLRAVLGSVAEGVVRQSRRPVLVVRPPER
jgi:nucleotide-binding universal stress UspA family protein